MSIVGYQVAGTPLRQQRSDLPRTNVNWLSLASKPRKCANCTELHEGMKLADSRAPMPQRARGSEAGTEKLRRHLQRDS